MIADADDGSLSLCLSRGENCGGGERGERADCGLLDEGATSERVIGAWHEV
jgi:hypothetical protein